MGMNKEGIRMYYENLDVLLWIWYLKFEIEKKFIRF